MKPASLSMFSGHRYPGLVEKCQDALAMSSWAHMLCIFHFPFKPLILHLRKLFLRSYVTGVGGSSWTPSGHSRSWRVGRSYPSPWSQRTQTTFGKVPSHPLKTSLYRPGQESVVCGSSGTWKCGVPCSVMKHFKMAT